MGSLMAGWATKPNDDAEALKRSSSSLTKDEVNKFWKAKQQQVQEHLAEATKDQATSPKTEVAKQMAEEIQRMQQEALANGATLSLPDNMSPNSAWWTRSKWAFLNDPPEVQSKQSNYVPQFDVATKGQMAQDHRSSSQF